MKHIIITGGTKGIGKAIVTLLLKSSDIHVHTCARSKEDLEALVSELGNPANLSTFVLDLGSAEEVRAFTSSWEGPLYGIVNNAGICQTEYLNENKPDVWDNVLAVNLTGPMLLVKGLQDKLQDKGRIVNISSQLGKEGRAGYSAYCASKFGLIGLTKTWAHELGLRGITVNAICPGWVATDMSVKDAKRIAELEGYSYDEYYKKVCSQLELKRFTKPVEIASLTEYLLSEEASGVTGRDWLLNIVWNQV